MADEHDPNNEDEAEAREDDASAGGGSEGAPEGEAEGASKPSAGDRAKKAKKKKKKKKRLESRGEGDEASSEEAGPAQGRSELDVDGRERPRFLLSFPEDPELERLMVAFERGDYATVRTDAPLLAERTESEAVRDAALELRRRLEPDPLLRYLILAAVVLLLVLVLHAYSHKP